MLNTWEKFWKKKQKQKKNQLLESANDSSFLKEKLM